MPDINAIAEIFGFDDDDEEEYEIFPFEPTEYMILLTGFRGGFKTLTLAWLGAEALREPDPVPVHSDLDYIEEGLRQFKGINQMPVMLDWGKLLELKLYIPGAVVQADEMSTKLNKLSVNSEQ